MPIGEKLIQEGKALSFVNNARGEDPRLANFMMEGLWRLRTISPRTGPQSKRL
jgi:hypothetical protein